MSGSYRPSGSHRSRATSTAPTHSYSGGGDPDGPLIHWRREWVSPIVPVTDMSDKEKNSNGDVKLGFKVLRWVPVVTDEMDEEDRSGDAMDVDMDAEGDGDVEASTPASTPAPEQPPTAAGDRLPISDSNSSADPSVSLSTPNLPPADPAGAAADVAAGLAPTDSVEVPEGQEGGGGGVNGKGVVGSREEEESGEGMDVQSGAPEPPLGMEASGGM
ncbi:hypothetical protein SAICODRAFT_21471 [Saitoella complicata NRRL Y-17804]|uniref:Uncharacterized protein n=1 Tax=Saitoella complicata (strain BCRC 22490 / CBS 7301 / JCM 7358 / NBRC 10748 / NRRL Y-17804) TaxID=698492 RepID=A0A0E9NKA5_SAICN|nr:uncharacterized protein SAICODRAFT_21471 [Saitoella complicata NRRL Y-17804]ODQ50496.1 hypothetical protein SAICODRAFT_21471 [Saitoella complicata NRRL Y-17804]GAO50274.1 hypothetical protein G7K_4404-t1 [Saitoella complicata NRRL Y-17804]